MYQCPRNTSDSRTLAGVPHQCLMVGLKTPVQMSDRISRHSSTILLRLTSENTTPLTMKAQYIPIKWGYFTREHCPDKLCGGCHFVTIFTAQAVVVGCGQCSWSQVWALLDSLQIRTASLWVIWLCLYRSRLNLTVGFMWLIVAEISPISCHNLMSVVKFPAHARWYVVLIELVLNSDQQACFKC